MGWNVGEKIFSNQVCPGLDALRGNSTINTLGIAGIRIFMWIDREFHGYWMFSRRQQVRQWNVFVDGLRWTFPETERRPSQLCTWQPMTWWWGLHGGRVPQADLCLLPHPPDPRPWLLTCTPRVFIVLRDWLVSVFWKPHTHGISEQPLIGSPLPSHKEDRGTLSVCL